MEGNLLELLDDDRFQAYHRELGKRPARFNAFDVLRYSDYEIRHSNVLAWLLRPDGSHGIGPQFLEWLVGKVRDLVPVPDARLLRQVDLGAPNVAVWRERDYVDITLLFRQERCLIAIENKTESAHSAHVNQVLGYDRDLRTKHKRHTVVSVLLTTSPDERIVHRDPSIAHISWKSVHAYIDSLHAADGEFRSSAIEAFVGQYLELVERWFRPIGGEVVTRLLKDHPTILKHLRRVLEEDGDDGVRNVVPENRAHYREALLRLVRQSGLDLVHLRKAVAKHLKPQGCDLHYTKAPQGRAYWLNWSNANLAHASQRLGCGKLFLSWGMTFTRETVRLGFYLHSEKSQEQQARLERITQFIQDTPINRQNPDGYSIRDNGFGWWQVHDVEFLSNDVLAEIPPHEVRDEVIRKLEDFMGSDESEYRRIEDYFRCLAFGSGELAST